VALESPKREDLAYVLHSRRFRENSLLVDVLSREHGRTSLIARAPSKAKSRLGESLQPFRLVQLTFSGRGDLFTLHQVEPTGPLRFLQGDRLLSGMYVNELLVRLTGRGEGEQPLFDLYAQVIDELVGVVPLEPLLRRFEVALLEVCGYGLPLRETWTDQLPVAPDAQYRYVIEQGPEQVHEAAGKASVSGAMLLALAGELAFTEETLAQAKHFMRGVLRHYLGEKPLHARTLFTSDR